MKAGSFNIHDYIGKLYEKTDEQKYESFLNEEEAGKIPDDNGIIIPEEGRKAYDWLKKEFQKGKTEVKVEISYHDFKPGYHLETDVKTVKDFKPGMYGQVKTSDTESGKKEKEAPFPETKFPGGETKDSEEDKKNKNESSEGEEDKKQNGIKVEAKIKDKEHKKEK